MLKAITFNLFLFLAFHPFFKFLPFINAENQPFCALFGLLLLFMRKTRIDKVLLCIIGMILLIAIYSVFGAMRGIRLYDIILLDIAYIIPVIVFLSVKYYGLFLPKIMFFFIVAVNLVIGIMQNFNLLGWASPIMETLISRGSTSHLSDIRGIALLTPEPSQAGRTIMLMIVTSCFFYTVGIIKSKKTFTVITICCCLLLLINKSGSGFSLTALFWITYMAAHLWSKKKREKLLNTFSRRFVFVVLILFAIPVFLILIEYLNDLFEARIIQILYNVKNAVESQDLPYYRILALAAGKRYLTVLMGYMSLATNGGLGRGIASYTVDFLYLQDYTGIDLSSIETLSQLDRGLTVSKTDAYAANFTQDMGVFGLLILLLLFSRVWRFKPLKKDSNLYSGISNISPTLKNRIFALRLSMFSVAAYMVFINTPTSLPVPWIILGYVCILNSVRYSKPPTQESSHHSLNSDKVLS